MGDRLSYLDKGGHFHCVTDGTEVVKTSREYPTKARAEAKLAIYEGEYSHLKDYLREYAHDSVFSVEERRGWVVTVRQEHVSGTPLRRSLGQPNPAVQDFFRRCISMYDEIGMVPDLYPDIMPDPSLGIYLTGKFTYTSDANVLLVPETPLLIDTTLNNSLRSNLLGPLLRPLVAARIRSLIK